MAQAQDCLFPMGITSENISQRFGVTRKEQDQAAKVVAATAFGKFKDEIIPVKTKIVDPKIGEETPVTIYVDDGIRPGTNLVDLAKLKPVLLARYITFVAVGVPLAIMGIGPAVAIPAAVKAAGLEVNDIDLFEINEVPWSNERPLENKELNAIIGAWFTLWRD
ncbi:3-ketoacyl-CoA thiolase 2, peroxisomal [Tanacetum coccineum]